MPSSFSAEVMAHAGWDSLVVDMQHGMIDYQIMVTMLQGDFDHEYRAAGARAVERPGAYPEGARRRRLRHHLPDDQQSGRGREIRRSCRYAPLGYRSSGPIRAALYGGADYHMKANDIVVAFGMIETAEAMENLDEIMSVKGLDAIYIGPSDLSISYGYPPGGDKPDQWMMDALKKVLDACKRHKVSPASIAARRPMQSR